MLAPFQQFLYPKLKLSDFYATCTDLLRSPASGGIRENSSIRREPNCGIHKPLCVNIPAHLQVINRSTGFKSEFDKGAFSGRLSFQTGEGDLYVTLKAQLPSR